MKKLIIAIIILSLALTSCSLFRPEIVDSTDIPETEEPKPQTDTTILVDTTAETTEKEEVPLPCLIGFYDDLQNNGTYTRLTEWNEPWIAGKDIAVFDVIPSASDTLTSASYKKMWKEESEKVSPNSLVKPYFTLRFTLGDGTQKEYSISSYEDAERITAEGYLEVYLYDDIHQEDGVWYYHLTKDTTNDNTVISSFKLTAGQRISEVETVSLTAFIEGSSGATVDIVCENQT